jgi:hypothetical protein
LAPQDAGELVADDLDDLLGGAEAPQDLLAQGLFLDPGLEIPDDLVVDVRLEEGQAHHLQGLGHVLVRDLDLAPEVLHHPLEAFGKLVEHRVLSLGPS